MEYGKLIFLINKEEERAGRRTEPVQGVAPSALHLLNPEIFLVPSASSLCSFVQFSYVVVVTFKLFLSLFTPHRWKRHHFLSGRKKIRGGKCSADKSSSASLP